MAAPQQKRRRLQSGAVASLRARLPYVSQSALAALFKEAQSEPLPTEGATSRASIRKARDQCVSSSTPYGAVHQQVDIAEGLTIDVQHPLAMLFWACKNSPRFSDMLERCLAKAPCTQANPWRIVVYCDEVSPGNQLAYKHERRTWAFYWSLLEFRSFLADEDLCFSICFRTNFSFSWSG